MKIAFYGSSLLSSYWNGAATYYRGLLRALAALGYDITFFEPDVYDRSRHRDLEPPDWCRVEVYEATPQSLLDVARRAVEADIVVKASGVGYEDEALLLEVLRHARPDALTVFWDVDAPATLAQLRTEPYHPLHRLLKRVDLVLTYGGGDAVIEAYRAFGAAACFPIYNALDPLTHHPVTAEARFGADLGFLGNRLPDRESRVDSFFFEAARRLPERRFILGGAGWGDRDLPSNVRWVGHVGTADHNAFNASPMAVLNINRASMAETGFSPPTRIFEAAGAGACVITDVWPGIDKFLMPGEEILVVRDGLDLAEVIAQLQPPDARELGQAALCRVTAEHTYAHRAAEADAILRRYARQRTAEAAE
ncbi:glycosyltransferase [Mesorhizobium sp. BR1-1-16]|uniref:CgeB family protein n=1 Tax=Mesorhizobium sp. BR1-1-16 TaxID=2876653 RepID=UPI001CCAF9D5|nr:glycosyltransferase [Mesorhizobium sp. BR1-1-16]MBZ9936963.1 glycosyltransferase [Mesorhizobium sp. BR1-1-16]